MTKEEVRARITEIGIIPAVRLYSAEDALFAAETIIESGIPLVEVTMTVPGALKVIAELAKHYGGTLIVGAGSLFDAATAQECLDAGAEFLTTPREPDLEIVDFAVKNGTVVFPGALTPGEITAMWKAGADFVKIFPCAQVGGPSYIRDAQTAVPEGSADRIRRRQPGKIPSISFARERPPWALDGTSFTRTRSSAARTGGFANSRTGT